MKHNDRIAKPKPGFSFPVSVPEAISKIKALRFEVWKSGSFDFETKTFVDGGSTRNDRTDLHFISGDKPLQYGFPLACLRRLCDIAIFSLPDELFSRIMAVAALDRVLEEFSKIDQIPEQTVKQTHFFVYRAYIGELGKITLTKDLLKLGARGYLHFEAALDPRKFSGDEKVLLEIHLQKI
jgi:hypothetical protein